MDFLLIITMLALFLFLPLSAQAYLDPGVGNMLVQLLAAGLAGVLTLLKIFGGRLKNIIKNIIKKKKNQDKLD